MTRSSPKPPPRPKPGTMSPRWRSRRSFNTSVAAPRQSAANWLLPPNSEIQSRRQLSGSLCLPVPHSHRCSPGDFTTALPCRQSFPQFSLSKLLPVPPSSFRVFGVFRGSALPYPALLHSAFRLPRSAFNWFPGARPKRVTKGAKSCQKVPKSEGQVLK